MSLGPDDYVAKKRGKFFKSRKHQFQIITEGAMVGKRKANQMMEKIAKMAKESEKEKNRSERYEEGRKEYFKRALAMYNDAERQETKEEYFKRLMKRSTSLDKVLEFLKFKKQADKLLPQMQEEIVKLVRKELEIDIAEENLNLEANIASEEGTPLLEAFGEKLGTNFANII